MPAAAEPVVLMDIVDEPPEVIEAGLNETLTPAGAPAAVRLTACGAPAVVVVLTVADSEPPAVRRAGGRRDGDGEVLRRGLVDDEEQLVRRAGARGW